MEIRRQRIMLHYIAFYGDALFSSLSTHIGLAEGVRVEQQKGKWQLVKLISGLVSNIKLGVYCDVFRLFGF